jgi:hypothetical protein
MAKVRAKSLTCPNCGAPVAVRNVFKAKTVVCDNCDSQLDLTTPDFKVLGQLPDRQPPQDAVCLGLKGELPDGRSFEIIGRIRFSDFDDEEDWFWDEWLLLAENGEYLWLQEEGRSFELHTEFTPNSPPDIDVLRSARTIDLDGTQYRVKERGSPRVSYVEGELTWTASIGDTVHYVDARGPGGGFGVEFNDDEIEFFRRKRMSRVEAWRMCGLDGLLALEDRRDELRAEYESGPKAMGCGGLIMAGGGVFAFLLFMVFAGIGSKVGSGTHTSIPVAQIESAMQLGTAKLAAGSNYTLDFDSTAHPALTSADLALTDPQGKRHVMLKISNLQKTGVAEGSRSFRAETDGLHRVELSGRGSVVPTVGGSTAKAFSNVKWYVRSEPLNGSGFFFGGPLLLMFGIGLFIVSAGRRSAASAQAAREFRKERAEFIENLQRESRVQS